MNKLGILYFRRVFNLITTFGDLMKIFFYCKTFDCVNHQRSRIETLWKNLVVANIITQCIIINRYTVV